MYWSSPFRSALNMCAGAKECHHPHPTPPHPIPCDVCEGDSGWRKWCNIVPVCTCDSSLCARVTLENGCVRTWLQSVCAGDSGWKKWCKIVPVCTCDSRVCARVNPWPYMAFPKNIGCPCKETTKFRFDHILVTKSSKHSWEVHFILIQQVPFSRGEIGLASVICGVVCRLTLGGPEMPSVCRSKKCHLLRPKTNNVPLKNDGFWRWKAMPF